MFLFLFGCVVFIPVFFWFVKKLAVWLDPRPAHLLEIAVQKARTEGFEAGLQHAGDKGTRSGFFDNQRF